MSALRTARDGFRDLPAGTAPAIACISASPAPFVPQQHHFRPGVGIIVVGFGTSEEHAAALAPMSQLLIFLFGVQRPGR